VSSLSFETWMHAGKRYLAIPHDRGVSIITEKGENYGTWYSVASFRSRKPEEVEVLGQAFLSVRC